MTVHSTRQYLCVEQHGSQIMLLGTLTARCNAEVEVLRRVRGVGGDHHRRHVVGALGQRRADADGPPFAGEDTRKGLYKMPKAWIQNGAWGLLILAVTVGGHLMFAERQQVYGHNPRVCDLHVRSRNGARSRNLHAGRNLHGGYLHTRHRQEEARGAARLFFAGVFGIP